LRAQTYHQNSSAGIQGMQRISVLKKNPIGLLHACGFVPPRLACSVD